MSFQEAVDSYCRTVGVRPQILFIVCYDELGRALADFQAWKNKGYESPQVKEYLIEFGFELI